MARRTTIAAGPDFSRPATLRLRLRSPSMSVPRATDSGSDAPTRHPTPNHIIPIILNRPLPQQVSPVVRPSVPAPPVPCDKFPRSGDNSMADESREALAAERIAALPIWSGAVAPERLAGGITNVNFTVADAGARYVVRVGDDVPVHQILRFNEAAASRAAHAAGE